MSDLGRPEQTTRDLREGRELSLERLCRIQVGALRSRNTWPARRRCYGSRVGCHGCYVRSNDISIYFYVTNYAQVTDSRGTNRR